MNGFYKSALKRVQRHFPEVKEIVDATEPVLVSVTNEDSTKGKKGDPAACALARACIRQEHIDGCIIGLSTSYLIKGKTATRYHTSETVGREITSFDRHQDFASGDNYRLAAVTPSHRLDRPRKRKRKDNHSGPSGTSGQKYKVHRTHRTTRVRVLSDL